MAKRHFVDLPDDAEGVILVAVVYHDAKKRSSLHVHHHSAAVPFSVAREALVTALAALEPGDDPRFKADPRAAEAARGLEYVDERDVPKTRH